MDIPSINEINKWLPFLVSPLEIEDFLGNRELYPVSLPLTEKGSYLAAASLRYWLKETSAETPRKTPRNFGESRGKLKKTKDTEKKLVLTSRFLAAVPNVGLALLLAVDACQPRQILEIYAEKIQESGQKRLGQRPESDQRRLGQRPEKLGTVISLTEVDKKKKTLGKVVFSLGKKQVLEIKPEEIIHILVDKDTELKLDFHLRAAKVLGKTKTRISVSGGKVGVVIDSRGRPIEPGEGEEGWEKIKRWTRVFVNV